MPTEQKEQQVRELAEQLQGVSGLVLADFSGLTVEGVTELRRRCREEDVKYLVIKNRLARLAIRGTPLENLSKALKGPTGMACSTADPAAPARIIVGFERQFGKPRLKAGWVEGTLVGADRVASIASLPSRQELRAQVTAGVGAPLSSLVSTLSALIGNLTGVIDGIRQKKEAATS